MFQTCYQTQEDRKSRIWSKPDQIRTEAHQIWLARRRSELLMRKCVWTSVIWRFRSGFSQTHLWWLAEPCCGSQTYNNMSQEKASTNSLLTAAHANGTLQHWDSITVSAIELCTRKKVTKICQIPFVFKFDCIISTTIQLSNHNCIQLLCASLSWQSLWWQSSTAVEREHLRRCQWKMHVSTKPLGCPYRFFSVEK